MEQALPQLTNKYKDFAHFIHLEVHVVRRLPNYNPTMMEWNIGKATARLFKDECEECANRWEEMQREKNKPAPKKDSFLNKLGDAANYVP